MSTIYCSKSQCNRTAHGLVSKITQRPVCSVCWDAETTGYLDGLKHRTELSETEETNRGIYLACVLQLKQNPEGRFMLGEGYHTKTPLGLYRTLRSIILDGNTEGRNTHP